MIEFTPKREVLRPVDHRVPELVEAERDRRDRERQTHQQERLIARVAQELAVDARRRDLVDETAHERTS